jgi:hypothetical protein
MRFSASASAPELDEKLTDVIDESIGRSGVPGWALELHDGPSLEMTMV